MSEKIVVKCKGCASIFHALSDELAQLRCPQCDGELEAADAAPLPEKPNFEETVKEYTFSDKKTTPEEARRIKEQFSPPGSASSSSPSIPPGQGQNPQPSSSSPVPAPRTPPAPASPPDPEVSPSDEDARDIRQLVSAHERIASNVADVVVGQNDVLHEILVAILARGHCLIEAVPGVGKTRLLQSISEALSLSFSHIHCTPDLSLSDIVGTGAIQEGAKTGAKTPDFLPGSIFANMILLDGFNRMPPKLQSVILDAMQDRQISVGGAIHMLPDPFFVLAVQNPIDEEGIFPLAEAQQDCFLFKICMGYPSEDEEKLVMRRAAENQIVTVEPVLDRDNLLAAQQLVSKVPVPDAVIEYAARIVRATRPGTPDTAEFVKDWVAWGCGPRASINLVCAAKALASLRGSDCVSCDDVSGVVPSVLRHRLILNEKAKGEGVTPEQVTEMILEASGKEA